MSTGNYRSNEPLFIVILHLDQANRLLRDWVKNLKLSITVENNRMLIYDNRSLEFFRIHWPHGWDNVVIWDCWNRRHIDI